uniref:Reverse transcriptase domain-containing protein n=1 Tax=Tanacetum cinerariifolium TaxID=118510 RepID=A0A6L2L025_TANCI|nr:hypothetical protein [Tanacetum cinerariifolium]
MHETVLRDYVELDGKIVKEEEEAVKRIKGEVLKEKDDPGAFIFPIRLEGQVNKNALADTGSNINTMPYRIYKHLGREEMKKVDRGITMINHTQVEAMRILTNILCQVGVTTLISTLLIFDILIDRDAPIVVGRGFLRTIGGIVNTPERLLLTFDGFCHQTFRAERSDVMRNTKSDSDDEEEYQIKRNKLWEHMMMRSDHQDPNALDKMKPWKMYYFQKFTMSSFYFKDVVEMQSLEIDDMLRITLSEAGSNEELFTSVAWIRAFNINEPIYVELCHEFYLICEFDEVYADDELQTRKIIKFRLGGRAHSLTLFKFAQRLGQYQAVELDKEGFNVYFEGDSKNYLWLLSMFDARHQNGYANVAWLITRGMKRKGAGTQKESQIYYRQLILKIARKCRVLTEDVVRSLSALIYCRDLDTITLRDLIDFEGKLIPEDPKPGVPRVGIPRPPRASMQDLYDRMEIRQEAIERMEYRHSYH